MRYWLIILINSIILGKTYSQPSPRSTELREVSYDTIPVGYNTSVNLIFDSPVKQWDMGLGLRIEGGQQVWDVLVKNSPESPKRIKLAAGIEEFKTTNLFVETVTAYYNFILKYKDRPRKLLYQIQIDQAEILKGNLSVSEDNFEDISPSQGRIIKDSAFHLRNSAGGQTASQKEVNDSLKYYSQIVLGNEDSFNPIGKSSQQILFFLSGIYIHKGHLFFKLYLRNDSSIPFDIGFIGFFKSDRGRKGSKQRPMQDEHLTPEFITDKERKSLESKGEILKVFVFRKFTLSKRKRLYIQLWEGDQGERKIELVVKGKDLLRAVPLASLQTERGN